jgi:transposase-like protein
MGGVQHGVGRLGRGTPGKTIVFGMAERGGPIVAKVIPDVKKPTLRAVFNAHVEEGSIVSTDEFISYGLLTEDGYHHGSVRHNKKEWTRTDRFGIKHGTNSIESFWQMFKNSIRSTHIHVSQKHMQKYVDEFCFRANHRDRVNAMFDLLVGAL